MTINVKFPLHRKNGARESITVPMACGKGPPRHWVLREDKFAPVSLTADAPINVAVAEKAVVVELRWWKDANGNESCYYMEI